MAQQNNFKKLHSTCTGQILTVSECRLIKLLPIIFFTNYSTFTTFRNGQFYEAALHQLHRQSFVPCNVFDKCKVASLLRKHVRRNNME